MHRHALDLEGLLHFVTRGAGNRRDDGPLGPGQGIEQGGLARIGLPGDHHADAVTQQSALARSAQHPRHRVVQSLQLALGVGLAQKINFFFGKVQGGFHQQAQAHQRVAQLVHFA